MAEPVKHMKWWGWGEENVQFDISDKPALWPYIERIFKLQSEPARRPPVRLDEIEMPAQRLDDEFLDAIGHGLSPQQIKTDKHERLIHAYGKSFRDLWRVRNGVVEAAPDCVLYPESEADIEAIVQQAARHNVVLIPFGGGSNIAGCLEARDRFDRMVVSLDMGRMSRVLQVDRDSQTATIQPGVLGAHMEEQLKQHGVTLGHFPDSFLHSTLGGWVATRSAGMQSDKYGKIEDIVISLRMVTPSGTIVTRPVPRSSSGIDVNRVCIGSEGILGVITEATVQVHPIPEEKIWLGYLFPDFESGVAAVHQCALQDCLPVITRLNDASKTQLSFAFKTKGSWFHEKLSGLMKWYLGSIKQMDFDKCCLLIVAFEGTRRGVRQQRKKVNSIYRRHGGVCLGTSPGKAFERGKFDFPYLRDWVMDRQIYADVSETATVWSNLLPLYKRCMSSIQSAIDATGCEGWLGCHISHNYHSGASLYFTFAWHDETPDVLRHYLSLKKAAEDAFLAGGATLSHHHAVGTEHLPWVEEDISPAGVKAVRALKDGLDPQGIMNPGKVLPSDNPQADWGWVDEETSIAE